MNVATEAFLAVAVLLLALGANLLLPHRRGRAKPRRVHLAGALLAAAGLAALMLTLERPAEPITAGFFYAFAVVSLAGGLLTVTSRDPVFNALSFALVLLATSGLFLLVGAQFLAAGTVIVYAGAIVVTFLFVIMLAQAEGEAVYDRMARAPGLTTLAAFMILAALAYGIGVVREPATRGRGTGEVVGPVHPALLGPGNNKPDQATIEAYKVNLVGAEVETRLSRASELVGRIERMGDAGLSHVITMALTPTSNMAYADQGDPASGVPPPHVAGLGGTLYTDHLITVELAGAILFVALVGAVSIATPRRPTRGSATR